MDINFLKGGNKNYKPATVIKQYHIVSGPVISTVTLLTSCSGVFSPFGLALGTLFASIKNVKINKTQAAVLGARVLRLTKLTLSPNETNTELAQSPIISDLLNNFASVCDRVNTVVKQHDDSKWYKKTFTHSKFKREFEMCNKLLDDFSTEILIAYAGKTFEKLPPLSQQKIEAIIDFDEEKFQTALADHNQVLLKEIRTEFRELEKQLSITTKKSIKAALKEQQQQNSEQRKALQNDFLEVQKSKSLTPTISAVDLEIDWETINFSGQSEVVFAEYELSEVVIKLYYHSGGIAPELAREFSILNSLPNVPSLPRIYGLTVIPRNGKDRYGLVMERLSSVTLKEKVPKLTTETKKLSILISIANALVSSHESKFLHRDLKPDNILFRGSCPVIIDWGSGKSIGNSNMSLSLNSNRVLTPNWASPELVSDETIYSDTIDVFSFALISIYVFTQETIWQDFEQQPNRDQLIIGCLRTGDIPDIPFNQNLPSCLTPLFQQCLKFKYIERPNMQQVVSVLSVYRHKKPPVECLNLENIYLCDYGLALIDEDYVLNSTLETCLEIYTKLVQLLEFCYCQSVSTKFLLVLNLIETHQKIPSSLFERKTCVEGLLKRRFAAQEAIPVFNLCESNEEEFKVVVEMDVPDQSNFTSRNHL
ncbi:hypothetical protein GEMRC1_012654 [Eukaryota sp. GEM-RC1]